MIVSGLKKITNAHETVENADGTFRNVNANGQERLFETQYALENVHAKNKESLYSPPHRALFKEFLINKLHNLPAVEKESLSYYLNLNGME
jgi:hypothetical protein